MSAPDVQAADTALPPAPLILLVEDDADIREALAEMLETEGYQVIGAANGRAALRRLTDGLRPALIILDVMMPVMDGWDFRLQQSRDPALRDIPVAVMSASSLNAETVRQQFGAVAYLPKPLEPQATVELVRRLCSGIAR